MPSIHSAPAFATTPPPSNNQERIGVLLCNLGTPDAPTAPAVRQYLAEFLSDPRVVELPALLWKPILHGIILRTRPKESAHKYASIWMDDEGSPLMAYTKKQALMLRGWLGEAGIRHVDVAIGMRYGQPGIIKQLQTWQQQGIDKMLIVPLYPQYSATTTASMTDLVYDWARQQRNVPDLRFIKQYATHAGYISALERRVTQHWQSHGRPDVLLLSYHGIPQRNVTLGDPYQQQCTDTTNALIKRLGLQTGQYRMTFQSRFGRAKWIEPYTQATVEQLARQGVKVLDVMCPGFSSDCLETLEEINMEVRQAFMANGGKEFRYIPCLNDHPDWITGLRDLVLANISGFVA